MFQQVVALYGYILCRYLYELLERNKYGILGLLRDVLETQSMNWFTIYSEILIWVKSETK